MSEIRADNFGLIKLGKAEWLNNIKNGKLWFRKLDYYRKHEDSNIGDSNEGVTNIMLPRDNREMHFYLSICSNDFIDLSNCRIHAIPKYYDDLYIFCLSYVTVGDIENKTIFHDSILTANEWDSVFFFIEPENFKKSILDTLKNYNPLIGKIRYLDFSKNQENLDLLCKSNKYEHQKEIRIAITYSNETDDRIKRIDENTIEVQLNTPIAGFIVPTASFGEGFRNHD